MIYNNIAEICKKKGLDYMRPSDDQLKEMNFSRNMWNKFFHKRKDPTLGQLVRIAEFMECPVADLIATNGR